MGSAPSSSLLQDAQLSAERLNRECFCITLDRDALCRGAGTGGWRSGFLRDLHQDASASVLQCPGIPVGE